MNVGAAAILDAIGGNAVLLDPEGRIVAANEAWVQFCVSNGGDPAVAIPPASYFASLPADDPAGVGIRRVLTGARDAYQRVYPCHAPSEERWFRVVATRLADGGALVVHYDITAEQERVAAILETSPFPIIELTLDGDAVYVSPAWARVTGQNEADSLGEGWLVAIAPHDRGRVADTIAAAIAREESCSIDARMAEAGRSGWIRLVARPHRDGFGQLRRYVLSAVDVTADLVNALRLSQVAQYDELTGLANRVQFEIALTAALAGLDAHPGNVDGVGVLFLDLDEFKAINDQHGHVAGDVVIRESAKRIAQSLRPGDSAARFGGDEFLVLVSRTPDAERLEDLARRIARAVQSPVVLSDGTEVTVGVSIGGALLRRGLEYTEVIGIADQAMYRAKAGDGVDVVDVEEDPPHGKVL